MKKTLLFRVNGQPQGKGRPRSTKGGRHYTPAKTRQYEAEIRAAAMKAAQLQGWLKSDEPLRVHIGAWFAVPKSWSKKKREAAMAGNLYPTGKPDADNIAKAACDALNEIAYHDDSQVVECIIRKRYCFMQDDVPHITVFVERMPTMDEMKAEALAREAA